jgi:hypothetical protein
MAKLNLSLKNVETQTNDFSPIPDGQYTVVVSKAEVKETKAGGAAVNLAYQIVDGDHKNRIVFDFINIDHPTSQDAVKIGLQRLKTVAFATGLEADHIADTDDLIGKNPFGIIVKNEEKNGYKNTRVSAILRLSPVSAPAPKAETKTMAMSKPWKK